MEGKKERGCVVDGNVKNKKKKEEPEGLLSGSLYIEAAVALLPRILLLVRVFGSGVGAAHCPSLSPVSAPFLRNAHHFLPFRNPNPSVALALLHCVSLFLFQPSIVCFRSIATSLLFFSRNSLNRSRCLPLMYTLARCLFSICVVWPAQIPPSRTFADVRSRYIHTVRFVRAEALLLFPSAPAAGRTGRRFSKFAIAPVLLAHSVFTLCRARVWCDAIKPAGSASLSSHCRPWVHGSPGRRR